MKIRELAAFPFRVLHKTLVIATCVMGFCCFLCALLYVGIEGVEK